MTHLFRNLFRSPPTERDDDKFDSGKRYTLQDGQVIEVEIPAPPRKTEEELEEERRIKRERFLQRQKRFDENEEVLLRHFGPNKVPRGLNGSNFRGWG